MLPKFGRSGAPVARRGVVVALAVAVFCVVVGYRTALPAPFKYAAVAHQTPALSTTTTTAPPAAGPLVSRVDTPSPGRAPLAQAVTAATPRPPTAHRVRATVAAAADATKPAGPLPSQAVVCQTDLSLAQAPDAPYNFLCRQGDRPVTWPSPAITVYVGSLTVVQRAALPVALAQWEAAASFHVTFTTRVGQAQATIEDTALGAQQPGYREDGYTTVAYRCDPKCGYDHATVVLSSSVSLTQVGWVSTLLHELGHVAGLNHVSDAGEVMYPYLTSTSPAVYTPGDLSGLQVLAALRNS